MTAFEPLYISVQAFEGQDLFKFIVEDCYATPSGDPMDTTQYLFFNNKCGVDESYKVSLSLIQGCRGMTMKMTYYV